MHLVLKPVMLIFFQDDLTIEPAVYYDMSFKDGDYSKIGSK